jgi:hypothetical protein
VARLGSASRRSLDRGLNHSAGRRGISKGEMSQILIARMRHSPADKPEGRSVLRERSVGALKSGAGFRRRGEIFEPGGVGFRRPGRTHALAEMDKAVDDHLGAGCRLANGDIERAGGAATLLSEGNSWRFLLFPTVVAREVIEADDVDRKAIGRREAAAGQFAKHEFAAHAPRAIVERLLYPFIAGTVAAREQLLMFEPPMVE